MKNKMPRRLWCRKAANADDFEDDFDGNATDNHKNQLFNRNKTKAGVDRHHDDVGGKDTTHNHDQDYTNENDLKTIRTVPTSRTASSTSRRSGSASGSGGYSADASGSRTTTISSSSTSHNNDKIINDRNSSPKFKYYSRPRFNPKDPYSVSAATAEASVQLSTSNTTTTTASMRLPAATERMRRGDDIVLGQQQQQRGRTMARVDHRPDAKNDHHEDDLRDTSTDSDYRAVEWIRSRSGNGNGGMSPLELSEDATKAWQRGVGNRSRHQRSSNGGSSSSGSGSSRGSGSDGDDPSGIRTTSSSITAKNCNPTNRHRHPHEATMLSIEIDELSTYQKMMNVGPAAVATPISVMSSSGTTVSSRTDLDRPEPDDGDGDSQPPFPPSPNRGGTRREQQPPPSQSLLMTSMGNSPQKHNHNNKNKHSTKLRQDDDDILNTTATTIDTTVDSTNNTPVRTYDATDVDRRELEVIVRAVRELQKERSYESWQQEAPRRRGRSSNRSTGGRSLRDHFDDSRSRSRSRGRRQQRRDLFRNRTNRLNGSDFQNDDYEYDDLFYFDYGTDNDGTDNDGADKDNAGSTPRLERQTRSLETTATNDHIQHQQQNLRRKWHSISPPPTIRRNKSPSRYVMEPSPGPSRGGLFTVLRQNVGGNGRNKTGSAFPDSLSDVPSDVPNDTRERYLKACRLLKGAMIEREKTLLPNERLFLQSLLGEKNGETGNGRDKQDESQLFSEERLSAIETASQTLLSDPLFQEPQPRQGTVYASCFDDDEDDEDTYEDDILQQNNHTDTTNGEMFSLLGEEKTEMGNATAMTNATTNTNNTNNTANSVARFDGKDFPFYILGVTPDFKIGVLTPSLMESLRGFFPHSVAEENFWLKYSLQRDGPSLPVMLSRLRTSKYTVLGVETKDGHVFGAFCSSPWRVQSSWFGSQQCFLWRLKRSRLLTNQYRGKETADTSSSTANAASVSSPSRRNFENDDEMEIYPYTGNDNLIQYCTRATIAIGGGMNWPLPQSSDLPDTHSSSTGYGSYSHTNAKLSPHAGEPIGIGFMIDGDLMGGETNSCATFNNPRLGNRLVQGNEYDVKNLEVWTLTPTTSIEEAEKLEMHRHFTDDDAVKRYKAGG